MKEDLSETIAIPSDVTIEVVDKTVHAHKAQNTVSRRFIIPNVSIQHTEKEIILSAKKATKREKKLLYSTRAHIQNMINGVQTPYTYILKICSGHFPMTVTLANGILTIKNFLGEKIARTTQIIANTLVKVEGQTITVSSADKEAAGRVASNIELLMHIPKRDRRVFQDGIFIIKKPEWSYDEQ